MTGASGLHDDIVRSSEQADLLHLPGVATATEIEHAMTLGMSWLKAFPASALTN